MTALDPAVREHGRHGKGTTTCGDPVAREAALTTRGPAPLLEVARTQVPPVPAAVTGGRAGRGTRIRASVEGLEVPGNGRRTDPSGGPDRAAARARGTEGLTRTSSGVGPGVTVQEAGVKDLRLKGGTGRSVRVRDVPRMGTGREARVRGVPGMGIARPPPARDVRAIGPAGREMGDTGPPGTGAVEGNARRDPPGGSRRIADGGPRTRERTVHRWTCRRSTRM